MFIRSVRHGEEDDISFITLNVFKILDEDRHFGTVSPLFKDTVRPAGFRQHIIDEILLGNVERHDTDAQAGNFRIARAASELIDDRFGFRAVAAVPASFKNTVDMDEMDFRFTVVERRERVEQIVIELRVAESDQAFMAAAVVPQKMRLRHVERQAVIKDAFQIFKIGIFFIRHVRHEERCRRHLFRIAHDDGIAPAGKRADSFACLKLRCLIEDDDIERFSVCIKILRNGDRTHQHARAEPRQKIRNLGEEFSDADAAAAAFDRALQDAEFGTFGGFPDEIRDIGRQSGDDLFLRQGRQFIVDASELFDLFVENGSRKSVQKRIVIERIDDQDFAESFSESGNDVFVRHAVFIGRNDIVQVTGPGRAGIGIPDGPFFQKIRISDELFTHLFFAGQPEIGTVQIEKRIKFSSDRKEFAESLIHRRDRSVRDLACSVEDPDGIVAADLTQSFGRRFDLFCEADDFRFIPDAVSHAEISEIFFIRFPETFQFRFVGLIAGKRFELTAEFIFGNMFLFKGVDAFLETAAFDGFREEIPGGNVDEFCREFPAVLFEKFRIPEFREFRILFFRRFPETEHRSEIFQIFRIVDGSGPGFREISAFSQFS